MAERAGNYNRRDIENAHPHYQTLRHRSQQHQIMGHRQHSNQGPHRHPVHRDQSTNTDDVRTVNEWSSRDRFNRRTGLPVPPFQSRTKVEMKDGRHDLPERRYRSSERVNGSDGSSSSGLPHRRFCDGYYANVQNEYREDDDAGDEEDNATDGMMRAPVSLPNHDMFRDLLTGGAYSHLPASGIPDLESAYTRISHDYADFEKKS